MGVDSLAGRAGRGFACRSLAGGFPTSRTGWWRRRFGVAALLIHLGTRGPPASPDREHDRNDQYGRAAGHQDDADRPEVQVRRLPGDAHLRIVPMMMSAMPSPIVTDLPPPLATVMRFRAGRFPNGRRTAPALARLSGGNPHFSNHTPTT